MILSVCVVASPLLAVLFDLQDVMSWFVYNYRGLRITLIIKRNAKKNCQSFPASLSQGHMAVV